MLLNGMIFILFKKMIEKTIKIRGWYLTKNPCERTYFLYSFEDRKSFDFEVYSDGNIKPH